MSQPSSLGRVYPMTILNLGGSSVRWTSRAQVCHHWQTTNDTRMWTGIGRELIPGVHHKLLWVKFASTVVSIFVCPCCNAIGGNLWSPNSWEKEWKDWKKTPVSTCVEGWKGGGPPAVAMERRHSSGLSPWVKPLPPSPLLSGRRRQWVYRRRAPQLIVNETQEFVSVVGPLGIPIIRKVSRPNTGSPFYGI